MPFIDLTPERELKVRPEILQDPHIPKPLHGLNPRTLLGQEWWDNQRFVAYKYYDYHCWACGVTAMEAKYSALLEAHERYKYKYRKARAEMIEVVALCKACHMFVHSGLTCTLYVAEEITFTRMHNVIWRGTTILTDAGMKPNPYALFSYRMVLDLMRQQGKHVVGHEESAQALKMYNLSDRHQLPKHPELGWSKWRLVIEGKKYKSIYKNMEEWEAAYS